MSGEHPRRDDELVRYEGEFRDDRIFYIGCDDRYAPDQYFGFFRMPRIKVRCYPATDNLSHAKHVLEKMRDIKCEDDDERWMILDTDHCTQPQHFPAYESAISEARAMGIRIAISRPCFEVWLALHRTGDIAGLKSAEDFSDRLKQVLGGYDKTKLRQEDFPIDSVPDAYRRARDIDAKVSGGDNPEAVTTRVYRVWRNIILKAAQSQLTERLRQLATEIRAEGTS